MSSSVFGKARSSSKVGVELDQEGNEILIETREDEGQQVKLNEIIDLLVAAGYFRARIKGISSFDKVVGGMTWCITNCSFDIDIDLLFQENSTIGQKISLTEKIVTVLRIMACPNRIEPHQIQGSDFKSIFPVIQWLVKKVIETREEMGDHRRAYSISQFHKHHKLPEDGDEMKQAKLRETVGSLRHHYRPIRKFKRVGDKELLTTEEARVSSTLLEYGRLSAIQSRAKENESSMEGADASRVNKKLSETKKAVEAAFVKSDEVEADDEEENLRIAQEKTLQVLMDGMSQMSGREIEGKLASRVIGSIVGMQSDEIHQISHTFAKKQAEIDEVRRQLTPAEEHVKTMTRLDDLYQAQVSERNEVSGQLSTVLQQKEKCQQGVNAILKTTTEIRQKISEMEKLEENTDKHILQKLKSLVMMNEQLKHQETLFKSNCKEEASKMKKEITELTQQIEEKKSVGNSNMSLVEKQWKADNEKLSKIRLLLAAKSRQAAALNRKVDEIPSRAELTQYQKRFVELYDQVAFTHKETKQFYTMYNTTNDSLRYLEKEADLLDSIYDNFEPATLSQANMVQYLQQFEKIVEGVKANKLKVEKQRQAEKMKRDELNERFHDLVDKHRQYIKTIHDFQEECRKNEILLSKLGNFGAE